MGHLEAVETTLKALTLTSADAGAADLARAYASSLDNGSGDLNEIGPKLLAVLSALGATPVSRSRMKGGAKADVSGTPNPLTLVRGSG